MSRAPGVMGPFLGGSDSAVAESAWTDGRSQMGGGTLSGSAGLSGITGLTQKVSCQIIKSAVSEIKASAIYFRPGTLVSSKAYVVEPFRTLELLEVGQGGTEKCI